MDLKDFLVEEALWKAREMEKKFINRLNEGDDPFLVLNDFLKLLGYDEVCTALRNNLIRSNYVNRTSKESDQGKMADNTGSS